MEKTPKIQCMTIVYPYKQGARFDFDYYLKKHTPMWVPFVGEGKVEVRRGVVSPNGAPVPFVCLTRIWVTDADALIALVKDKGHHLIEDIPNYTNIEPVIQFDEMLLGG